MKVFLTFRIFLCILILRETCPQHLRENGTVTDLYLISEENIDQMRRVLDRGPYFDTSATKNVTSLVGKTGHLNCRIKNLGNKTRLGYNRRYLTPKFSQVSWIRHRDLHLLTVSESTYTSDQRFTSIYNKQTGDWSLQRGELNYPQAKVRTSTKIAIYDYKRRSEGSGFCITKTRRILAAER
ncbi:uncharacterized protein LOC26536134 isoform X10 [Drosophila yakuba]|uniref:uncharacterized protein LOC26536134 isoform X10 n=1 Tax=Drosophila yakuba TaxID=7245 RepID=UPI0019308711|nr:uncharacterized protein LOC26536134 isoform X10 [Drosophila yakuba]